MARREVDADRRYRDAGLGRIPDTHVAEALGLPRVPHVPVPRAPPLVAVPKVDRRRIADWSQADWTQSDAEIAGRLGTSEGSVRTKRYRTPKRPHKWQDAWDALLGTCPDPDLAARLGVRPGGARPQRAHARQSHMRRASISATSTRASAALRQARPGAQGVTVHTRGVGGGSVRHRRAGRGSEAVAQATQARQANTLSMGLRLVLSRPLAGAGEIDSRPLDNKATVALLFSHGRSAAEGERG